MQQVYVESRCASQTFNKKNKSWQTRWVQCPSHAQTMPRHPLADRGIPSVHWVVSSLCRDQLQWTWAQPSIIAHNLYCTQALWHLHIDAPCVTLMAAFTCAIYQLNILYTSHYLFILYIVFGIFKMYSGKHLPLGDFWLLILFHWRKLCRAAEYCVRVLVVKVSDVGLLTPLAFFLFQNCYSKGLFQ